jgi:hypothetical protein
MPKQAATERKKSCYQFAASSCLAISYLSIGGEIISVGILSGLAEFLESGIGAQRIPERIEP